MLLSVVAIAKVLEVAMRPFYDFVEILASQPCYGYRLLWNTKKSATLRIKKNGEIRIEVIVHKTGTDSIRFGVLWLWNVFLLPKKHNLASYCI